MGSRWALACLLFARLSAADVSADPVPAWHPHRIRRRERHASHAAVLASSTEPPPAPELEFTFSSSLGCGELTSPTWERRVCFGQLVVVEAASGLAGLPLVAVNVTVTARPVGSDAEHAPACGAALRVVLVSHRARLAPTAALREAECGTFPARFTLPRVAPEYSAEVHLLHSGLAEAETQAGLALVNVPVVVPGVVRLGEQLVLPESGVGALLDPYDLHSAFLPAFDEQSLRQQPAATARCSDAAAPGHWAFTHSMYGAEYGEPLAWVPHGCHWARIPGMRLANCGKAWYDNRSHARFRGEGPSPGGGAWLFAGGGQLLQVAADLFAKTRLELYYSSPLATQNIDGVDAKANASAHALFATRRWDTADAAAAAGAASLPPPPLGTEGARSAWLLGLGAGDAAAGTEPAAYGAAVQRWLSSLQAAVADGALPPPRRVVWLTAAAAVYKPGPAFAGAVSCAPGAPTCEAALSSSFRRAPLGGFEWVAQPVARAAAAVAVTAPVIRAYNAAAVAAVKATFPDALILDYEALTEGLPPDFSWDGLHWGCDAAALAAEAAQVPPSPWRCRALGNAVAGQVLSNLLCEGAISEHGGPL